MKNRIVFCVLASTLLVGCGHFLSEEAHRLDDATDKTPKIKTTLQQSPQIKPANAREYTQRYSRYGNPAHYKVGGKSYHVRPITQGYQQKGTASWYGKKFHHHRTSSGEVYDMHAMTAAHKTLPLPTTVRVKNLENGRSVVVRVNDRGPFHGDRVIDLSYAAAKSLGFAEKGLGQVVVESFPSETTRFEYFIQAGAFQNTLAAHQLALDIKRYLNMPVNVTKIEQINHIEIGPMSTESESLEIQSKLAEKGISDSFSFIRRAKP